MEKKFNLKVSARISPNCKKKVEAISFSQLLVRGSDEEEPKKFQLDKIYQHTDKNEKLFQNILRVPTNLMIEGLSSVILCLGGPNSGKTYTLAGKLGYSFAQLCEPGMMIFIMRRLFSKFKHQVSLHSTYSFWCKFCYVQHNQVITFNPNPHEKQNQKDGIFEVKSYSQFQQLISNVYRSNSNKRHTIIELILKKQNTFNKVTTSSITFVEFGSFFYNCPYRQAEQLSMENDIDTVLNAIKNLSRSRQNPDQLFGASMLTKALKQNFLSSTSFELIGMLDENSQNNLKTLNFLDIVMHQKQDKNMVTNFREQIKRQEIYLKNLFQKHRKVLNMLSRCIGMELGYLEKQKKTRNFEGPILNTFYKTCEKIKYANLKKLQNEKTIEEIRQAIEKEMKHLTEIEQQYQQKNNIVFAKEKVLKNKKQNIQRIYHDLIAPNIKFSNADNSLFWKCDENEAPIPNKYTPEDENMLKDGFDSERDSKLDLKQGLFPTTKKVLATHKNIVKGQSYFKQKVEKYQKSKIKDKLQLNQLKAAALKYEIVQMFQEISDQQKTIEEESKKIPSHFNILINRVKNRSKNIKFNKKIIQKCIRDHPSPSSSRRYEQAVKNSEIHKKFQKEQIVPNLPSNVGLMSNKSLRSQVLLKY